MDRSNLVVVTKFGSFELRPGSRKLFKFGTKVKLRPQPFQVLSLLLDHAGEVVTREQFRQELWPADTFVDFEHSLNTAIKELRGVLSDSATEPRYIQTVPKLGYRFIFAIARPAPDAPPVAREPATHRPATFCSCSTARPDPVRAKMGLALSPAAAVSLMGESGSVRCAWECFVSPQTARRRPRRGPARQSRSWDSRICPRKPSQDWMSTAMREMLGAELASGRQIRVIPGEEHRPHGT